MGMKEKERRGTTQERNDPQTDKTKLKTHRKQNSNDESNKQPKTKTKNTEGETTTDPYFLIGKKHHTHFQGKAYGANLGDQRNTRRVGKKSKTLEIRPRNELPESNCTHKQQQIKTKKTGPNTHPEGRRAVTRNEELCYVLDMS